MMVNRCIIEGDFEWGEHAPEHTHCFVRFVWH